MKKWTKGVLTGIFAVCAAVVPVCAQENLVDMVPAEEGKTLSYLTGEPVQGDITRRPVAVMMGNNKAGAPQSGISSAGVIYEAPVEGNMTRLMGIFENYETIPKIGSVRSCRDYYTSYANEFEAIYAHFGQAVYAIPYLENIDNLNGLQLEGSVYFRTEDRKAPHNAYTSGERLLQGIQEKGYTQTYSENYINNNGHYQFAQAPSETLLESGIPASTVALDNYTDNHPWFEYNAETKEYERNQYGEPQIDLETGQQLTCDNIILQNSQYVPYDENGYLNIFCTGEGEGTFITRGKAIPIKWVYEEEHGMTHYYDENGQEIRLNPGRTWVEIILNGTEDAVSIQ